MTTRDPKPLSENELLRVVARSFQLSLRLVPRSRRATLSIAYLAARAADCAADLPGVDRAWRLRQLDAIRDALRDRVDPPFAPSPSTWDPSHREVHERLAEWIQRCHTLPEAHRGPTRRVLLELVEGMRLELCREAEGRPATDRDVLAHAYRAAGCVGRYWTELLFADRGRGDRRKRQLMIRLGIRLGMGLQLVNLLRDAPEDERRGRHHFPQPLDDHEILDTWLARARSFLASGFDYSERLPRRAWRDRLAVLLPTALGARTLALLRERFEELRAGERVKVTRADLARIVRALTFRLLWPKKAARIGRSWLTYDTHHRNLS